MQARQGLDRHALAARDLDDLLACLARRGRDRDQELVRPPIAKDVAKLGAGAEHPAGGQPVKDLGAIATYVASKSSGMTFAAKLDQPQEKAVVDTGHAIFFRRQGPHDFSCATCHNDSGKRIRLQGLPYLVGPKEAKEVVGQWPAYASRPRK